MHDWNGNGTYDSSDRYIDYKLSGGGSSSGTGGGTNGGSGLIIWLVVGAIIGAICEPIGVLIALGVIVYLIYH